MTHHCPNCKLQIPTGTHHTTSADCLTLALAKYHQQHEISRRQAISGGTSDQRIDRLKQQVQTANSLLRSEQRRCKRMETEAVRMEQIRRIEMQSAIVQAREIARLRKHLGLISVAIRRAA